VSAEIELKLELDPKDAGSLPRQALWRGTNHQSRQEHSVYYDTPSGKLRKHGFTLRVRSAPEGFVQTIKTIETGAGLFFRGEWEAPVDSQEPNIEQLNRTPAGELRAKKLQPVVRADVERTVWCSEKNGALLEFAMDEGELEADGRKARLCELEIELLKGRPNEAFDAARSIAEKVPVRIGVLSKAERGFALADEALARPAKASQVAVQPQMNVGDGFAMIAQSCLRQFRLNESLVLENRDPAALHQARVGMRRLRSALSMFRPALMDAEFLRLRGELRWFTARLGEARNLDVFLERDLRGDIREVISRDRERAYDHVIEALKSKRFRLLMIDFVRWISIGQWRAGDKSVRPLPDYAGKRIDRLWQRIAAHGDLRKMDDEGRHEVRTEIKRLRYGLEFLHALHDHESHRQKHFLKAIERLQEVLGHLNDIVTARDMFTQGFPAPESTHLERVPRLLSQAERRFRRLKKLGPYWSKACEV
jgi:inorganic triphosphatase YgiF